MVPISRTASSIAQTYIDSFATYGVKALFMKRPIKPTTFHSDLPEGESVSIKNTDGDTVGWVKSKSRPRKPTKDEIIAELQAKVAMLEAEIKYLKFHPNAEGGFDYPGGKTGPLMRRA